jgi:hypothetical protein
MKVLVQHPKTHKYLCIGACWTDRECDAINFENSAVAIVHCARQIGHAYQIVLKFGDSVQDVTLPIVDANSIATAA